MVCRAAGLGDFEPPKSVNFTNSFEFPLERIPSQNFIAPGCSTGIFKIQNFIRYSVIFKSLEIADVLLLQLSLAVAFPRVSFERGNSSRAFLVSLARGRLMHSRASGISHALPFRICIISPP